MQKIREASFSHILYSIQKYTIQMPDAKEKLKSKVLLITFMNKNLF
jgi:hypothetical protein